MSAMFFNFSKSRRIIEHYVSYHNVDKNNRFFQRLFQSKNKTLLKHFVRCSEFLTTEKHKSAHNFLKYESKRISFEDKPIDIVRFLGLTIYSIEFQKHKKLYNFFNSEKGVEDFSRNVRYKFKPAGKKIDEVLIYYRKHSEFTKSKFTTNYY